MQAGSAPFGLRKINNMKYRSSSLTGDGITMAVAAGAATLRKTIEDYDAYVMGTADSLEVEKLSVRGTVGEVEQDENGKYKPETYKLDQIRVRFMARTLFVRFKHCQNLPYRL